MKREDLLDFNFDWRDDAVFKKALKESGLSEKEKLRLRDERMRRLELEELKEESGGYDDYDYDDDDEEVIKEVSAEETEEASDEAEKEAPDEKSDREERKNRKAEKKREKENSVIVAIKGDYPIRKKAVALMMCIFMAILPYVTYLHPQPLTKLTQKYFSSNTGSINDWFLFQKEFFVVIAAFILIGIFIVEEFFIEKQWKDIPLRKKDMKLPLILVGVYALLLIVSGICSKNPELVLMGVVKHYEGLLGVLGYLIIFLAAINYFCDTKSLEFFSWAMILTTLACSIFGVSEYLGYPLQENDFFAHFIAPAEKYEYAKTLTSQSENVHITFFNSNYLGSFCGLMFPLTAALTVESIRSVIKRWNVRMSLFARIGLVAKMIFGIFGTAGIAVCAVLSNSTGGLYSVAGGAAILLIIYVIYWFRGNISRVSALITFVCIGAVLAGGFMYMMKTNDDFRARFDKVVNNGSANNTTVEDYRKKMAKKHYVLKEIKQDGSSLVLDDFSGNTITVSRKGDDGLEFLDTEGNILKASVNKDKFFCFKDERYKNCKFKYTSESKLLIDLGYSKNLIFKYEDDKFKPFVHGLYTQDTINSYKGPEFFKKDLSALSGRFFIWGATISILDDCLLIGKGSGSFVTVFPQYDYASLLEVYETPGMVVNKPHNWYLGVAVDSGMVSLMVLLTLLGAFLVKGFKTVILDPVDDRFKHLRIGTYVSVIAFMVVGIVNDSYVCVSPVFWFIFGVGWYAVSRNKVVETD
ncbi:O-antigen ligase family protein [Ruminococcus albus]|uniref:O-Antigen ligase n=1 Tax=Ruminococcus albus TaxID=1264 RepID=A0A1I1IJ74_RUMAL|nr:O-antigen ligase family protein [Ruminococcus albus]SFC36334.1 O-Antigen ligase [Ruminococcus albus]